MATQADIVVNELIDEFTGLWQDQSQTLKSKLVREAYEELGVPKMITRISINLLDATLKSNLENNKQKLIQKAKKYKSIERLLSWFLEKIQGNEPVDKLDNLSTEDFFEALKDLEDNIVQGVSWNPGLVFNTKSTGIEDNIIEQLNAHNQYHAYIGRGESKKKLQTFLDQDEAFSWMGITGGAGSGKTRFAHEVGQIAQQQYWRVGFLPKHSLKNLEQLQNWQPIVPTLIFIDYAKDHTAEVQNLLSTLSDKLWNGSVLVRLVLIDRYGFKITADNQTQGQINKKRFTQFEETVKSDNLVLPSLSDKEIRKLIKQFENIDVETVFNKIKEKHYQARPLYIFLLCLSEQEDIEGILKHLIKRQGKLPWDTEDNQFAMKSSEAIQIATLFGEFNNADFEIINVDIGNRQKVMKLAGHITQYTDNNLKPLEPDLLGEYFVLEFMDFLSKNNKSLKEALFNKDLNYYKAVIKRCHDDFPEKLKKLYPCLIEPLPENIKQEIDNYLAPNAEKLLEDHLIAVLTNNIEKAREIFAKLTILADNNKDNQEIQLTFADGAVNWLNGLNKNPANFEEARTVFTQLQTLAETNPNNSEIQLRLTKGAVNWLSGLNKNPANFEEARTVFTQLQTLAKTNPDNSEIQLRLAQGAFNWLSGLNKNPADFEEARTVFTQLQTLAETYHDNSEIQLELAKGAVNWLSGLNKNPADFEEARTVFTQLQTLAKTNPNNSEIQLELAKGAFNWLIGLNKNPNTIPNNEIKQVEKVLLGALSDLVQQVESFKPEFTEALRSSLKTFEKFEFLKKVAQDLQQAIQTHFSS